MTTPVKRKTTATATATKEVGPAGKITLPKLAEGQTFVHNCSPGNFHVPLMNPNPKAEEQPIKFELNEVRKLDANLIKEQRFLDSFDAGYLEEFNAEQYEAFLKKQNLRKSNETRKAATGNHKSGLPNNRTMAIQQIQMIDDSDVLQALYDEETRGSIMAAIEERLADLQDQPID
jgi:hypothetical protein